MKTRQTNSSTSNNPIHKPFFNKNDADLLFSKKELSSNPFFTPARKQPQQGIGQLDNNENKESALTKSNAPATIVKKGSAAAISLKPKTDELDLEKDHNEMEAVGGIIHEGQGELVTHQPRSRIATNPVLDTGTKNVIQKQGGRRRTTRPPLTIESETANQAPNGAPNTRRMIGVGEVISFRTRHPVEWVFDGTVRSTRRTRTFSWLWDTPGAYEVSARRGASSTSIRIRVIEPSVRTQQIQEIQVPTNEGYGVYMQLRFQLTPLNVSFNMLQFREVSGPPDPAGTWGHYASSNLRDHQASPIWSDIDNNNNVQLPDNALFVIHPRNMNWPMTPGGFRWIIPNQYQFGSTIRTFNQMTQAFRIDPTSGRPPFKGRVTLWKGGQRARRTYT